MDWQEFDTETRRLAQKIDYIPDIIVGIARGGVIPAALLAKLLNVKDMFVLAMQRDGNERRISTHVLIDVSGKEILLVEDMIETGRALLAGKKYLEAKRARVRTACLYTMPIPEIKPDYLLGEVKKVVEFPWNKH